MNISNFLCVSTASVLLIILDVIIVIGIAGVLLFMFYKTNLAKGSTPSTHKDTQPSEPSQTSADGEQVSETLVEQTAPQVEEQTVSETQEQADSQEFYGNRVEHFNNQIMNISEEASNELKVQVTFTPKETPELPKRVVKDETINLTEKKNAPIKVSSFEDSTTFLDTLKQQQTSEKQKPAAKTSGTKKPRTQTAAKKTTAKKDGSAEDKPKRKYTKKNKDEA